MKRRLRVGVTIFVRQGEQSLWSNGIFQNCLFLVRLLQQSPVVADACLVAGGEGNPNESKLLKDVSLPFMTMEQAMNELDVVIEMSAQLNPDWMAAFRAKGGRVAAMRVGNDYVIDIERMLFNKPHGMLANRAEYDEIWTLPQYAKTAAPYYASVFRKPVSLMPHLWSHEVLEHALKEQGRIDQFGYQPGRNRWRVGIVEPNLCMVKTSFIPMLSVEAAHRLNPNFLERMYCFNTHHLCEEPHFKPFALGLDVVQHGLGSFEGRVPMYDILTRHCDVIVSHQWENAQNYVYYEALYGGYPLIHNSHLLEDCGYRYEGFDCDGAARALLDAYASHDLQLADYRSTADRYLQKLQPDHPENIHVYSEALVRLGGHI